MTAARSLVRALLTAIFAATVALAAAPAGADEPAFSPEQKSEIETVIRDYLLRNPEVLIEAMDALSAKQEIAEEQRIQSLLTSQADEIYRNPEDPLAGNPEGDVVVVEFFDYQCPYCKRAFTSLLEAVNGDGNVRLVFKEFPILGPESTFAAKAALAAMRQGKYLPFHTALMAAKGTLSEAATLAIAAEVGLDVDRLRADMDLPEVAVRIEETYRLADQLDIRGTPAFLVGDRLIPGAVDLETMKRLIAEARAGT